LPVTGDRHPLRRESSRWLISAALASLILGVVLFGAWRLWSSRQAEAPVMRQVQIVRYTDLGVPPSIARPVAPQLNVATAVAAAVTPPAIGVPEPVADEQAQRQTIATVAEMAEALAPATISDLDMAGGDSLIVDVQAPVHPKPDEFIAVEEMPVRLAIDPPIYPAVATAAGVEGTVIVRVLVGKDGKVQDALVVDSIPMLDDAALACARTAVFKPALLQQRPIEVWVLIPVVFKLKN